ncbi:type II secretion system protein GspC [Aliikangiella sp. IMCC44653]
MAWKYDNLVEHDKFGVKEIMSFSNLMNATWYKNYQNWLPLVQWAGWVLCTYLLAKITWAWVGYIMTPTEFKPFQVQRVAVQSNSRSGVDFNQIVSRNLFGNVAQVKQAPVQQEKVVETKLNLKLRGIYAADSQHKANAIIEDGRGQQAVYFIGEQLKVSGRVFLREVEKDRVILETNGRREALRLEQHEMAIKLIGGERKPELNERKPDNSRQKVSDKRQDAELSQKLNDYRDKFQRDPTSIGEVIRGQPHVVNGELQGFRIQPGGDKRLFQELGLRRGDVVTAINGVTLTNMQDAMSLMNDVSSMQEVNVEIQRGKEQLSLLLNLNDKVGRR